MTRSSLWPPGIEGIRHRRPPPPAPPFRQWTPGRLRRPAPSGLLRLFITGRLSPRLYCRLPPRQHELTEALSSSTIPAPRSTGGVTPDWRSRHAAQKGREHGQTIAGTCPSSGGAHEKGARSGGQAPSRLSACAGRGNPALCRRPWDVRAGM